MINIGICMPYYEHMDCLRKVIQSYADCGYRESEQFRVKIYLCDDGSIREPVSTEDLKPFDCHIITLPRESAEFSNPSVPRNRTIERAVYEGVDLIYHTQPDIYHNMDVLTPGAVAMCDQLTKLYSEPDVIVRIPVKQAAEYGLTGTGLTREWQSHPRHRPVIYNTNYLATPALFRRSGYYDEGYRNLGYGAEDLDYFLKLQRHGVILEWLPDPDYSTHLFHEQRYSHNTESTKRLFAYFKSKWGFTPDDYFCDLYGVPRKSEERE